MDKLGGNSLLRRSGDMVSAEVALEGKKIICYYFSAHWCPPCRIFTPLLKDWYNEVTEKGVEVVFVSSDQTEAQMKEYIDESHGDWLAVVHGSDLSLTLRSNYSITGIPSVVVVKADGTLITKNGRADIHKDGPQCVTAWMKN